MNADPSSYYHALLAKAQALFPDLVGELDLTLFQTLLLALVAKQKHVVVRTADDNIPRVSKLAVNVSHRKTFVALYIGVDDVREEPKTRWLMVRAMVLGYYNAPYGYTRLCTIGVGSIQLVRWFSRLPSYLCIYLIMNKPIEFCVLRVLVDYRFCTHFSHSQS